MWNNAPGNQPPAPKSNYTAYEDFKPAQAPSTQQHAPNGSANLGPGLTLRGELSGQEDVYLDCKVEGPINFGGNRVTVGKNSVVTGDVVAREAVLHGKLSGDLRAHDRVEVKNGGALVGDLVTGRISIEEGAYFKGHIEVDPSSKPIKADLGTVLKSGAQS
jgi:cytoskeletal protein CcmA (bactofilin family)